jgi:hypothetical protein
MTFTLRLEQADETPADRWSAQVRRVRLPASSGPWALSAVWAYPLELCLSRALGQEMTRSGNTAR